MKSIRTFLLARLLGGAALILVAAGFFVYAVVARSLAEQFDRNLADRVQGFASLLFQMDDAVEFEFSGQLMPMYDPGPGAAYFQLWFDDGTVLERSESLAGVDLPALPGSTNSVAAEDGVPWSAALPDGRRGRFLRQTVEIHHVFPEEGPKRPQARRIVIAIAVDSADLERAERRVLASSLGGALLLLILIGVLAWVAVERGLEPARRLAGALSAIQVERLPEKLDVGELPRELVPMARTTDALLERVSSALERERRTSADIAHELRTPIAEILAASEVALRDGREPGGSTRALVTVRDVATRMGRSVATLLKLARLEMGAEPLTRQRVDVEDLVRAILRSHSALQRENRLEVASELDEPAWIEADPDVLRIVLSNLLGNALHDSPAGGRVVLQLRHAPPAWSILIENPAPHLAPEDLASFGEPFWRKDAARRDRERSGLGLALTRALVRHGGLTLEFRLEDGVLAAELGPAS